MPLLLGIGPTKEGIQMISPCPLWLSQCVSIATAASARSSGPQLAFVTNSGCTSRTSHLNYAGDVVPEELRVWRPLDYALAKQAGTNIFSDAVGR